METLVGRITKDATVATTKSNKQVVNFSIAVNDYYRPKGSSETQKITRYFNCAYWISTKIAESLAKGALVELNGRIGLNTWENMEGKTTASLTMQVSNIKLHGKGAGKNEGGAGAASATTATTASEANDDLPF